MKKIVVTGASGFLGQNLIRRLEKEEGMEIFALSGCFEALSEKQGCSGGRICFCSRDIICDDAASDIFRDSVVINCAFPRNSSGEERAAGMKYIKDLMLSCEKNGIAAFINVSSQSLYSAKRTSPAKETDPVCLDSVYAAEKYAVELMTEIVFARSGIPFTNIRLASLIGPGFDVRIVNRLVRQAKEKKEITVTENEALFGFMDVEDAAEGIASMLSSDPKSWKPVYNLGSRGAYTLRMIADSVREVLREDGSEITVRTAFGEGRDSSALDAQAFYEAFRFQPKISLKESIRRISREAG